MPPSLAGACRDSRWCVELLVVSGARGLALVGVSGTRVGQCITGLRRRRRSRVEPEHSVRRGEPALRAVGRRTRRGGGLLPQCCRTGAIGRIGTRSQRACLDPLRCALFSRRHALSRAYRRHRAAQPARARRHGHRLFGSQQSSGDNARLDLRRSACRRSAWRRSAHTGGEGRRSSRCWRERAIADSSGW
jgi:hypothetical protein